MTVCSDARRSIQRLIPSAHLPTDGSMTVMRQDFDWHAEAREGSQITSPHLCQEHIDKSRHDSLEETSALSVKCEPKLGCVCLYGGAGSVVGGVRLRLKELCLHMARACLNKNPYPCFTSCRFVLEQGTAQRSFSNKSASEDLTNLFFAHLFLAACANLYLWNWPACLFTGQCLYLQGLLLTCFDFESWNASGLVIQISWYVQLCLETKPNHCFTLAAARRCRR